MGPYALSFQVFLSLAAVTAPAHDLDPPSLISLSTALLNVSRGPPCFLFPSETQVKAIGVLATTMATATRTSKQQ